MKFIIGDKIKKDTRVGYLLVIDTMIGDADGNEDVEVGVFSNEELHLLQEVIETCDRMIAEYPHGRGGYDDYGHVQGFERWFTENGDDYEDIEHLAPFEWPGHPGYSDIENSIKGYELFYLDNGEKYKVKIVKSDN